MARRKSTWLIPLSFSVVIVLLWSFPSVWYKKAEKRKIQWYRERTEIENCNFLPVPVSQSAEKILVADRTLNGDFLLPDNRTVRVFSAKRYQEKQNEIGLFMHTPDRCWIEAGWQIESSEPQTTEVRLNEEPIRFERRVFVSGPNRELVYFGGLVGGKPLPYRLDHNLSIAHRLQAGSKKKAAAVGLRVSDGHFWKRLWDSFASREELFGPKQFIRISTPISADDMALADQRLREFLPRWLTPGDYEAEKRAWTELNVERKEIR